MCGYDISTHAPRVRRDLGELYHCFVAIISTHAPRVRRDANVLAREADDEDFYSRASCEARLRQDYETIVRIEFLLTRLV